MQQNSKNGTEAIIVNKNSEEKGREELSKYWAKSTKHSPDNLLVKGGNVLQPAQSNHKVNVTCEWWMADDFWLPKISKISTKTLENDW